MVDNNDLVEDELKDGAYLDYASKEGLVPTSDPDFEKEVFRRPGFEGIKSIDELDERISAFLKTARERKGLKQADVAPLCGLSAQVYGRYERNKSKMTVTRMIVLSEILGFELPEMLHEVAPHLWGETKEAAANRAELFVRMASLSDSMVNDLLSMVREIDRLKKGPATRT